MIGRGPSPPKARRLRSAGSSRTITVGPFVGLARESFAPRGQFDSSPHRWQTYRSRCASPSRLCWISIARATAPRFFPERRRAFPARFQTSYAPVDPVAPSQPLRPVEGPALLGQSTPPLPRRQATPWRLLPAHQKGRTAAPCRRSTGASSLLPGRYGAWDREEAPVLLCLRPEAVRTRSPAWLTCWTDWARIISMGGCSIESEMR